MALSQPARLGGRVVVRYRWGDGWSRSHVFNAKEDNWIEDGGPQRGIEQGELGSLSSIIQRSRRPTTGTVPWMRSSWRFVVPVPQPSELTSRKVSKGGRGRGVWLGVSLAALIWESEQMPRPRRWRIREADTGTDTRRGAP